MQVLAEVRGFHFMRPGYGADLRAPGRDDQLSNPDGHTIFRLKAWLAFVP